MIARYWRGRVRNEHAAEYAAYVERTGVNAHRATPGNLGSMVLEHRHEKETDIVVLSLWTSIQAVRGFAGEDPEKAIFFPEDARYLTEADPVVTHYEVPVIAMDSPATATRASELAPIPHHVYSDGRVQSLGLRTERGDATVGVILPGKHHFTATREEHVTVLDGTLDLKMDGTSRRVGPGESYVIPAGATFAVQAESSVSYHCRFGSALGSEF